MMLARFRAAYDQLPPEEFLVVQFLHCALRFVDGQHLDEGESLRTLVMPVSDDLGVLNCADAVEELEEVALRRVERQVPDVKPGRGHFDRFRFNPIVKWAERIGGCTVRGAGTQNAPAPKQEPEPVNNQPRQRKLRLVDVGTQSQASAVRTSQPTKQDRLHSALANSAWS